MRDRFEFSEIVQVVCQRAGLWSGWQHLFAVHCFLACKGSETCAHTQAFEDCFYIIMFVRLRADSSWRAAGQCLRLGEERGLDGLKNSETFCVFRASIYVFYFPKKFVNPSAGIRKSLIFRRKLAEGFDFQILQHRSAAMFVLQPCCLYLKYYSK